MEWLVLANRCQHLHHHLVVDHNVMASYLMFMLCLALLCFDQIQIRKKK